MTTASSSTSHKGLFRKYVVLLLGLVIGVLLISGGFSLYFLYQHEKSALATIQQEKAFAAASTIRQFIEQIESQIGWTTQLSLLPGAVGTEQRRLDYFRLLRQAPAITEIAFLDGSGKEQLQVSRLAMDRLNSQKDYSQTESFRIAQEAGIYYGPVYFRKESEPYMTLAVRGSVKQGDVTVAEINLKFIRDSIINIRVGSAGYAYVIDARNRLVAHPDLALVLRQTDLSTIPQVQAARAERNALQAEKSMITTSLDGHEVLAAYAAVSPLNWQVFVETPLSAAFAPLYTTLLWNAGLLLLGLLIAILASLFLARNLVIPIRALQDGAARLGAGQLSSRIDIATGDELQALAEHFNAMAAQLQELYSGLEQKVEERTQQLQLTLQEIEEKSRALELASQHKSQFLANMSHELRTPLNAILGYTELITDEIYGPVPEKISGVLERVEHNGRHLLGLINAVLDLSKIEAGQLTLALEDYSPREVIYEAVSAVESLASEKGLALSAKLPEQLPNGRGDAARLKQVLLNLLGNAIKFTDQGEVRVSMTLDGDGFTIAVSDTGPGIAPEQQTHIFEEFQQVDNSITREKGGTGLGLAIAHKIIALHGGEIGVKSEPGRGATFWFSVPVYVQRQQEAA